MVHFNSMELMIIYRGKTVMIGKFDCFNDSYFNGSIDDVRIYNRALSGAEITSIYDSVSVVADSDVDGVIDIWDLCADTPIGSVIDSDGCPANNKVVVVPLF